MAVGMNIIVITATAKSAGRGSTTRMNNTHHDIRNGIHMVHSTVSGEA